MIESTTEDRGVEPQDVPPDADPVDSDHIHGDRQQDDAEEPAGPFARLSDDLNAGRIQPDDALKRVLGALAGAEAEGGSLDSDAVLAGAYPDEYDDDGNPHEPHA